MRVRELDFLRGIALICVICTHTIGYFPTKFKEVNFFLGLGRYGVQLFFVISAFTMTMLAKNSSEYTVSGFYTKRFLRLFPLFLFAALAYYPTQILPNYWNPSGLKFWQFILAIFFLQGFLPNTINSTVPGGWSISNEANFYLFFPLIRKIVDKNRYLLIVIFSSLYFLSHHFLNDIFSIYPEYLVNNYFYLFLLNQINVFIYGMIVYNNIYNPKYKIKNDLIFYIFYLLLLSTLSYFLKDYNHLITNFIGIIFSLILYFNLKHFKLKYRVIEKIGNVTYTGYIIHFGILMILQKIYDFKFLYAFPIVILLTVIISLYLKPYTEDYWIKLGRRFLNLKISK